MSGDGVGDLVERSIHRLAQRDRWLATEVEHQVSDGESTRVLDLERDRAQLTAPDRASPAVAP